MHRIILTFFLALTLTSCGVFSWIWDKSEKLGKHMPVSQNAQRCEDGATCFGKREPEQQPQQDNNLQMNSAPYPQQPTQQGQGGYIPTSLPDYNGDPTMYDEMSKKLPPDMQDSPPIPQQPYQPPYPHYPTGTGY